MVRIFFNGGHHLVDQNMTPLQIPSLDSISLFQIYQQDEKAFDKPDTNPVHPVILSKTPFCFYF